MRSRQFAVRWLTHVVVCSIPVLFLHRLFGENIYSDIWFNYPVSDCTSTVVFIFPLLLDLVSDKIIVINCLFVYVFNFLDRCTCIWAPNIALLPLLSLPFPLSLLHSLSLSPLTLSPYLSIPTPLSFSPISPSPLSSPSLLLPPPPLLSDLDVRF